MTICQNIFINLHSIRTINQNSFINIYNIKLQLFHLICPKSKLIISFGPKALEQLLIWLLECSSSLVAVIYVMSNFWRIIIYRIRNRELAILAELYKSQKFGWLFNLFIFNKHLPHILCARHNKYIRIQT